LKFVEEFSDAKNAIEREKQIKGWTRKKKEALMKGEYNKLKEYSRCYGSTSLP